MVTTRAPKLYTSLFVLRTSSNISSGTLYPTSCKNSQNIANITQRENP